MRSALRPTRPAAPWDPGSHTSRAFLWGHRGLPPGPRRPACPACLPAPLAAGGWQTALPHPHPTLPGAAGHLPLPYRDGTSCSVTAGRGQSLPPSQRGLPGPPRPSPLPPSQAGNKAAFSWPVCPRPALTGAAQGPPALVTGYEHRLERGLAFVSVSSSALRHPGPTSGTFSYNPALTPS